MIESGQQFGLYVVKDVIELGAVKACYCAEDPFFNREVSLKLYPLDRFSEEQQRVQLESHLERLAVLDHPSLAPVYDSGKEDGYFYYTSAYYSGGSLAQRLMHSFSEAEALRVVFELTQALDYAFKQDLAQRQLVADSVFFDGTGRAVLCDFGVEELIAQLTGVAVSDETTVVETLQSLGVLLLQMLLGSAYKPEVPVDELRAGIENVSIRRLIGRFLLPDEWHFSTYAELLEELLCFDDLEGLSTSIAEENPEVEPEGVTNDFRAEENTDKMVADVRHLVAEKNSLQQSLDEALYDRKQAEKKLSEGERQLILARREIVRVKEEANVAWELVAGQKYERWRPVVWAVGGFVIGFLLSGSYGYYYSEQTRDELLAKLKENEELIKTATWRPTPPPQSSPLVTAVDNSPVETLAPEVDAVAIIATAEEEPVTTEESLELIVPVAEKSQSWWPVGSEFSVSAAIPMEQIRVALGFEGKEMRETLPEFLRQEVMATVKGWADSWSRQDLGNYFSFYSHNYRPELGRSQDEWRDMRSSRISRPEWIRLDVDDIRVRKIGKDRIQVKLRQSYRSDYYQDQILKSINLIKEDGQWRILMERSLGMIANSDVVGG